MAVLFLYCYEKCGPDSADARSNAKQRLFFCMFFAYPTICNIAFSTFLCRNLSPESSVLVQDDRLLCEEPQISDFLQPLSFLVIGTVAIGLPVLFLIILLVKSRKHSQEFYGLLAPPAVVNGSFSEACESSSRAEKISTASAVLVHRDVTILNDYAFMIESYKPDAHYFESVDMIRKMTLVGVVVLAGRGSVAQIAFGSVMSFLFFSLHVKIWPMKSHEDNMFRMAAELHVFWVITVAFVLKSDLTREIVKAEFYDWVLVISFAICIPIGFVVTVLSKLYRAQSAGVLGVGAIHATPKQAFARYVNGLASTKDRNVLRGEFDAIRNQDDASLRRSLSTLAAE